MTVGKIAAGVLIGNLATVLILWVLMSLFMESASTDALIDRANRQYETMNATR